MAYTVTLAGRGYIPAAQQTDYLNAKQIEMVNTMKSLATEIAKGTRLDEKRYVQTLLEGWFKNYSNNMLSITVLKDGVFLASINDLGVSFTDSSASTQSAINTSLATALTIPGPYADDAAAAAANPTVAVGKLYYKTGGAVYVRLT